MSSPYYFGISSFCTANISYVSPIRPSQPQSQLEDVLIRICEQLNRDLPATPHPDPQLRPAVQEKVEKKSSTPVKRLESETTSEGSNVKSPKAETRIRDLKREFGLTPRQPANKVVNEDENEDEDKDEDENENEEDKATTGGSEKKGGSLEERIIRKRKRKSIDQLKLLVEEYRSNPSWNKNTMSDVARKTGLTEAQVYKWGWDQKKKKVEESTSSSIANLYN